MRQIIFTFLGVSLLSVPNCVAQVGMGTTNPNTSAVLDLSSTTKGFLPPRMDTAQRTAITTPIAGLMIYNTDLNLLETYDGVRWTNITSVAMAETDVYNPTTGKIWMDRNLGATQVATSSNNAAAYGDLYQWGRAADGHQLRTSSTTAIQSSSSTPGHANFITNSTANDRLSTKNDNLWQGVSGTNNPCPSGYRLPTSVEWDAERLSWSSNNAAGAFASPLKLPLAGKRNPFTGAVTTLDGNYWSSTIQPTAPTSSRSKVLIINSTSATVLFNNVTRDQGYSVRCIKN